MTDDELDRALFALPLATPPPGLRERIVALTHQTVPAPVSTLVLGRSDIVAIGLSLSMATWLVVSGVARSVVGASGVLLEHAGSAIDRAGGETTLLLWFVLGLAIAAFTTNASRFDRLLRRS